MKTPRLLILTLVATVCLAAHSVFATVPEYTYTFEANPNADQTFNGSTITIAGNTLVDWNLFTTGVDYTPANSSKSTGINSYDAFTWQGAFEVEANNNSGYFQGGGDGTIPNTGNLDFFSQCNCATNSADPTGVWVGAQVTAPDSGSTLALLAIGVGGMVFVSRRLARA